MTRHRRSWAWLARVWRLIRIAGWACLLYLLVSPWSELGGLVSERLRWLERLVTLSGPIVGYLVGGLASDALERDPGLTRGRLLRWLVYPPGLLTAAGQVLLWWIGWEAMIGVVATAFVAYLAGVDLAYGVIPHAEGERPWLEERLRARHGAEWPPWSLR